MLSYFSAFSEAILISWSQKFWIASWASFIFSYDALFILPIFVIDSWHFSKLFSFIRKNPGVSTKFFDSRGFKNKRGIRLNIIKYIFHSSKCSSMYIKVSWVAPQAAEYIIMALCLREFDPISPVMMKLELAAADENIPPQICPNIIIGMIFSNIPKKRAIILNNPRAELIRALNFLPLVSFKIEK